MYFLSDEDKQVLQDIVAREKGRPKNQTGKQPSVITTAKNRRIGKTDAAIDKDGSGTVSVYKGTTKGSETDSGNDVEAYNRFGDIEAGKWVLVEFISGGWEIYQGEC